jgi:hypothetical protein
MKTLGALFLRDDSPYKKYDFIDCYDKSRNALNYSGNMPVICHPPCRAWGVLSHMANPEPGEKELAIWAVNKIREVGGILEHPKGSRLWKEFPLPYPGDFDDEFGGFSILIDQWDFGHVAYKKTRLYICGYQGELPELPNPRLEIPKRSICGNIAGTVRCTQYQREYTPEKLIEWLIRVAEKCGH